MKYLIVMSSLTFFLLSCNKEKQFKKSLIGVWNASSIAEDAYDANGNLSDSYDMSDFTKYRYTFNEDGTGSFISAGTSGEVKYPIIWDYNHDLATLSVSFDLFFEDTFVYDITTHERNNSLSLNLNHTYYNLEFGLNGEKLVGSYVLVKV